MSHFPSRFSTPFKFKHGLMFVFDSVFYNQNDYKVEVEYVEMRYNCVEFLSMLKKRKVVYLNLVLIPVDGSIRSEKSIEFASSILELSSIKAIVFHIMKPGGNKTEAETFVNRAKASLEKHGFIDVKTEIVESLTDPSEEILNMISRENIDFVIMSAYGYGRSEESNEIGSVAIAVVNRAKCSIILVK